MVKYILKMFGFFLTCYCSLMLLAWVVPSAGELTYGMLPLTSLCCLVFVLIICDSTEFQYVCRSLIPPLLYLFFPILAILLLFIERRQCKNDFRYTYLLYKTAVCMIGVLVLMGFPLLNLAVMAIPGWPDVPFQLYTSPLLLLFAAATIYLWAKVKELTKADASREAEEAALTYIFASRSEKARILRGEAGEKRNAHPETRLFNKEAVKGDIVTQEDKLL